MAIMIIIIQSYAERKLCRDFVRQDFVCRDFDPGPFTHTLVVSTKIHCVPNSDYYSHHHWSVNNKKIYDCSS